MKKLICTFACLWLLPNVCFAGTNSSTQCFNDEDSFVVAASVKLGHEEKKNLGAGKGGNKPVTEDEYQPREDFKKECHKFKQCPQHYRCDNGTCVPKDPCDPNPCSGTLPSCTATGIGTYKCSCTSTSCGAGKKCSGGACTNCSAGEVCNCPTGQIANGSGGCKQNPCSPNPCSGSTPTCTLSGGNASCICTSTSCGGGKACNGSGCYNCTAGQTCNCPSGEVANGSGGCKNADPCFGITCSSGKRCSNGSCINCNLGQDCGCSDFGQISSGSGSCKSPDPCEGVTCPAGKKCNGGNCVNCTKGETCGCTAKKKADGSGNCTCQSPIPDWNGTECYLDTCGTCKSYEYCLNQKCVLQAGRCYTKADCLSEHLCKSNSCVPGCAVDADCNSSRNCYSGTCNTPCTQLKPCTNSKYPNCGGTTPGLSGRKAGYYCYCNSTSCGTGYECAGTNTYNTPNNTTRCVSTTCTRDSDCSAYKNCYNGQCKTACEYSNPCTNSRYPRCLTTTPGTGGRKAGYYCMCQGASCGSGYTCPSSYGYSSANTNRSDSNLCQVEKTTGPCTKDMDCPYSYQNCVSGECKYYCSYNSPCTNSKYPNCVNTSGVNGKRGGYYCNCTSSSCGSGYSCGDSYVSYDKNTPNSNKCKIATTEKCTTNDDCSSEKYCSGGWCIFK